MRARLVLCLLCAVPLLAVAQEQAYDGVSHALLYTIELNDGAEMTFRFVPTDTADVYVSDGGDTLGRVSGYFIGSTEVTRKQWQAVMGENACGSGGDKGDAAYTDRGELPAVGMSLAAIRHFLHLIDSITGIPLRLPTWQEWVVAAQGGERYPYPGASRADCVAWHIGNSRGLHPVAQKVPNSLGLYDMSGNASEWTVTTFQGETSTWPQDIHLKVNAKGDRLQGDTSSGLQDTHLKVNAKGDAFQGDTSTGLQDIHLKDNAKGDTLQGDTSSGLQDIHLKVNAKGDTLQGDVLSGLDDQVLLSDGKTVIYNIVGGSCMTCAENCRIPVLPSTAAGITSATPSQVLLSETDSQSLQYVGFRLVFNESFYAIVSTQSRH